MAEPTLKEILNDIEIVMDDIPTPIPGIKTTEQVSWLDLIDEEPPVPPAAPEPRQSTMAAITR